MLTHYIWRNQPYGIALANHATTLPSGENYSASSRASANDKLAERLRLRENKVWLQPQRRLKIRCGLSWVSGVKNKVRLANWLIKHVFHYIFTTSRATGKWRAPLDSAHRIGPKTTWKEILIVVWRPLLRGGKVIMEDHVYNYSDTTRADTAKQRAPVESPCWVGLATVLSDFMMAVWGGSSAGQKTAIDPIFWSRDAGALPWLEFR